MRSILNNKKGQFDPGITTFAVILIGLLILAPVGVKVVRTMLGKTSEKLTNSTDTAQQAAGANVSYIMGVFLNFWDGVIIAAFVFTIMILFISAFLIDSHPIFIPLYIIIFVLTVMFSPYCLEAVNRIWEANALAEDVVYLDMVNYIRLNFGLILTVVGILSMVIIYAKVRFYPSGS